MYTVYVIESQRNGKRYTGYTSKNVKRRLDEHNRGCNRWTKANGPFRLIYTEVYTLKNVAQKRERSLKSGQGRKFLDTLFPR
jgi:predicted GIY-YIG superfamily endonuclease